MFTGARERGKNARLPDRTRRIPTNSIPTGYCGTLRLLTPRIEVKPLSGQDDLVDAIADVDVPDAEAARKLSIKVLPSTTPFVLFQYRVPIGSSREFDGAYDNHGQYGHVASHVRCGVVTVRAFGPIGVVVVRLRPEAAPRFLGSGMGSLIVSIAYSAPFAPHVGQDRPIGDSAAIDGITDTQPVAKRLAIAVVANPDGARVTFPAPHNCCHRMFSMTIDDIVSRLLSAYIPGGWTTAQQVLITNRDVGEWSEKAGLSGGAFYDAIALRLASGFQNDAFEFGFCDQVVNDLHAVISVQNEDRTKLFWDVFLAFDAGEFYPNDDQSIDPVDALTRPRIAGIVRKCSAQLRGFSSGVQ
jgi:hypothetical protein